MKAILRTLTLTAAISAGALVAGLLSPANPAFADPPEPSAASCMGLEASAISPPGSSAEPGAEDGMRGVSKIFHQFGLTGSFAHAHLGTHEACDEALLP